MERSVLVRRTAPFAVFVAVLATLVAIAARDGGPTGSRPLTALPLAAGGARADARAEGGSRPADSKATYYGNGEIVIPDSLLTGLPTEGPVHEIGTSPSTDRIEALARALGVSGTVRADENGWVVGDGDVVLRVMKQAGLHWYLGPDKVAVDEHPAVVGSAEPGIEPVPPQPAPAPTTEPTAKPDGDTPVSSDGSCPSAPDGAEPACTEPGQPRAEPTKPPQPAEAEARAAAQKVFDALGLTGATVTVNDVWSGLEVVAAPVVGGLPTVGFETRVSVEVGPRIQYASGFLGGTTFENDYPLLAPRDAAARGGAWGPAVMRADMAAPCPPEQPCPTPEPREATEIRLGLMFMPSFDASHGAFLAPAWLLTFEGSTWEEPVLALPDRFIATPPPAVDQPASDQPASDVTVDSGSAGGGSAGSTGAPGK